MAHDHSYVITKNNNVTEKQGIKFVIMQDSRFVEIDLKSKKKVMESLGINKKFARSFDLIMFKRKIDFDRELLINNVDDITLVELKTTQKKLDNFPSGFFFGATENEFELAKQLGKRYKFCFVSLHCDTRKYILLSYEELVKRIRNKRIQYQINLK